MIFLFILNWFYGQSGFENMKINLLRFLIAPKVYSIYNTIPKNNKSLYKILKFARHGGVRL